MYDVTKNTFFSLKTEQKFVPDWYQGEPVSKFIHKKVFWNQVKMLKPSKNIFKKVSFGSISEWSYSRSELLSHFYSCSKLLENLTLSIFIKNYYVFVSTLLHKMPFFILERAVLGRVASSHDSRNDYGSVRSACFSPFAVLVLNSVPRKYHSSMRRNVGREKSFKHILSWWGAGSECMCQT